MLRSAYGSVVWLDGTHSVAALMAYPTALSVDDFATNLSDVRTRIEAARARSPFGQRVRLLPVSKTVPEERIRQAIEAGCRQLGENKPQEAHRKWQALSDTPASWSVIGHLQTNKAKLVAECACEFQALDSLRTAETLDRRLRAAGRELDVFVQVNTSAEQSKFGLNPGEVEEFLRQLPRFSTLRVRGLMTLAVFSSDTALVRECFVSLRTLRDRLRENAPPQEVGLEELSMGMSGDYETAIEEGATVVRVGQAIFGARDRPDIDVRSSTDSDQ